MTLRGPENFHLLNNRYVFYQTTVHKSTQSFKHKNFPHHSAVRRAVEISFLHHFIDTVLYIWSNTTRNPQSMVRKFRNSHQLRMRNRSRYGH